MLSSIKWMYYCLSRHFFTCENLDWFQFFLTVNNAVVNIFALCFCIQTFRNDVIETSNMTMHKALETCTIVFQKNCTQLSPPQAVNSHGFKPLVLGVWNLTAIHSQGSCDVAILT